LGLEGFDPSGLTGYVSSEQTASVVAAAQAAANSISNQYAANSFAFGASDIAGPAKKSSAGTMEVLLWVEEPTDQCQVRRWPTWVRMWP
jgi:hypothetical protein